MNNQKLSIPHTTWNFKSLFDGDDDPKILEERKKIEAANKAFIAKWKPRMDYLENPLVLGEALDEYEALEQSGGQEGNAGYYFSLRTTQNENDPALKARYNASQEFSLKLRNEIIFFLLCLGKISAEKQKEFLAHPD